MAYLTKLANESRWSFKKILARWVSTVFTLIFRVDAISLFDLPFARKV
jgi:hypothetical protein